MEKKYLKLFYKFCKNNNLVQFLPKTIDNDITNIRNYKPLIIITANSQIQFNPSFSYIYFSRQFYDYDKFEENNNDRKTTFFPESLICLLSKKSRFTSVKLNNFCLIYNKWIHFIRDEIVNDFIIFMNTIKISPLLKCYKFYIMRLAEKKAYKASDIIYYSLYMLQSRIKKDYAKKTDSQSSVYLEFYNLHLKWKNFLLKKI